MTVFLVPLQVSAADTTLFRATLDSVFAGRAYRWAEEPWFFALLRAWWRWLGEWLNGLRVGNPLVFRALLVLLVVVLIIVFGHAVYVAYRTLRGAVQALNPPARWPAVPSRDAAWYQEEADRAAAEGRLLEALQLAFAAVALTLDARGLLRYHPSMTPAECAAAARLTDTDRVRLRALVRALYGHVFGGAPCAVDDYVRWRTASALPWQSPHAAAH